MPEPSTSAAASPRPGRLVLAAGSLRVELAPALGGSIARFDRIAHGAPMPLLRGVGAEATGPLDCACFPLVPYANRIRGGSFAFRGETIRLSPNMAHDPPPLHGDGWLAEWDVVRHTDDSAELRFRHDPGDWPWAYEARQVFRLDPAGLVAELTCTNLATRPMPCGLGLHPYFPCDGETRLSTGVAGTWTVDASILPVSRVPATGRYCLADRAICGQDLDNGYDGWSGSALIHWPRQGQALRMTSPDAAFFQVYAPPGGGLFAAEPVQHANCALNAPEGQWPALGLAVLEPGETRSLCTRWTVEPA